MLITLLFSDKFFRKQKNFSSKTDVTYTRTKQTNSHHPRLEFLLLFTAWNTGTAASAQPQGQGRLGRQRVRLFSRLGLSDSFHPTHCSPHGSSGPGLFQVRIRKWFATSFWGIFLTQGLNPRLLHCRPTVLPLSHWGNSPGKAD